MISTIKGLGKAYTAYKKTKKAEKAARAKLSPEVGGPARDPEIIKLNKQIKTAKKIGAGAVGTLSAATIAGKVKQNKKDKQRGRK
jgi:hypothetical protein